MKAYIYKITNKMNNKVYIGSTNNIEKRWEKHIYDLNKGIHHSKKLQNAWNKYGQDNFKFEIIEEFIINEREDKFEIEQKYIDRYESYSEKGYNMSDVADTRNIYRAINSENSVFTKINKDMAIKIKRELCFTNKSHRKIASDFNVGRSVVGNIARLNTWKEYGEEYNDVLISKMRKVVPSDYYKDDIMNMYFVQGLSHSQIAKTLNIDENMCSKITRFERERRAGNTRICKKCEEEFILKKVINKNGVKYIPKNRKYCYKCSK